ncbi:MAG: glycosyltransferase [Erysipelotrichaceae bacterium]|nr:glycosyltransferase [Erysipelotrichaceae bacterium]
MKVLLLSANMRNIAKPYFNLNTHPYGGWVDGFIDNLQLNHNIKFDYVYFKLGKSNNIQSVNIKCINYYQVTYSNNKIIKKFFKENKYDIYHIFGIEHPFIKDISNFLPFSKTLLYIQGIQKESAKVYLADYNKFSKNINPFLYLNLNILKYIAHKLGNNETKILKKGLYITGRTKWDYDYVKSVNRNIKYYYCNEILRSKFYTAKKWNPKECLPHTIFVSQANYTLKAAHMIIEIVKILKKEFSNVKCYIAGENIIKSNSIMTKLNSSYAGYIKSLINKYKLDNNIIYTGPLGEEEIINYLQKINVFLSASVIENSSNSLQEAMLIGTPCVASNVGGISSIANETQCLLYPFSDINKCVSHISNIFNKKIDIDNLSNNAIKRIEFLANPKINSNTMYNIYKDIVSESKNEN